MIRASRATGMAFGGVRASASGGVDPTGVPGTTAVAAATLAVPSPLSPTGAAVTPLALVAVGLLLGGAGLVFSARRRTP